MLREKERKKERLNREIDRNEIIYIKLSGFYNGS